MRDTNTASGENKTKGEKVKANCLKCLRETNHVVLQSVERETSEIVGYHNEGHPESIEETDSYQIIQCQGCDTISFRHVSWCSEDVFQVGIDEWDMGERIELYPKRSLHAARNYPGAPANVERIYSESITCYNSDALTLCAAGLRATLDGICADQGIDKGPVKCTKKDGTTGIVQSKELNGKINGLSEKKILSERQAEILHELRFLGNDAVHDLYRPSSDELLSAIQILEHTLDTLYEMPERADLLTIGRSKRPKRSSKSQQE